MLTELNGCDNDVFVSHWHIFAGGLSCRQVQNCTAAAMCNHVLHQVEHLSHYKRNKEAQLLLTNLRDAKACQKLLQFNVLTTLSVTKLAYIHSFNCCCIRNL